MQRTRITAFVAACEPFALSLWGIWRDILIGLRSIEMFCGVSYVENDTKAS